MNKYQEALYYIKHDLEYNDFIRYKNGNHVDKYHREVLLKLVDKEIPMKPKHKEVANLSQDGFFPLVIGHCDKCGWEDLTELNSYCSNCGQRIDWSDEE